MCGCGNSNCGNCSISVNQVQGPAGVGVSTATYSSGDLLITLTNGTVLTMPLGITNGTSGSNGQSVDHTSRTSGNGNPGTTDIYTVWGDVGETINLGTFNVYQGINGTNGTNNMSLLYSFLTSLENGETNATTGGWVTMKTFPLPSGLLAIGEYLDIDIKIQTTSGSLFGIPLDYFKMTFDGADIISKYPYGTELLPLTNYNVGEPATYNINVKLYRTGTLPLQAQCSFSRNDIFGTPASARLAGGIQINPSPLASKNLATGGDITFQVYQTGANSVKLGAITIKHIKF